MASWRRTAPRRRRILKIDPLVTATDSVWSLDHRLLNEVNHDFDAAGKTPVSVIVPVKNEADNLRRCLPALSWADEVFVVDSQSSDETAEVADALGATVVPFHFNGTYPKKKNSALENLPFRNEWVLIVDADEGRPPRPGGGDRDPDRPRRRRWLLLELSLLLPGPTDPALRLFRLLEPTTIQTSARA